MPKHLARIFILCVLSAALLEVSQANKADTAKQFEKTSIAPGQIHEACLVLSPTEKWRYAFTSSGKLSFNLHYHADDKVYYPVPARLAADAKDLFTPVTQQNYCLMWTNTGTETVELNLEHEKLSGAK